MLVLIAFFNLLISDLVGWEPTMYSDGLVSKESLRADMVGAMLVGVVVGAVVGACCGGRWRSFGWRWRRSWSLGWYQRRCSGGALELWWVLLALLVHMVVVVG